MGDVGIEGRLRIGLRRRDGRILQVRIGSSRPLQLPRRFAGKDVAEVLQTIPLLYGVCGTAQAGAAVMACRQALGIRVVPSIALAESLLVGIETAREHLWRVLVDWPGEGGEAVDPRRLAGISTLLADARRALFGGQAAVFTLQPELQVDARTLADLLERLSGILAQAVFGEPADAWYARDSLAGLESWIAGKATGAARYLAQLAEQDLARLGETSVPALPAIEAGLLHRRLQRDDADAFIAAPRWRESPRETTPLTRQAGHPLIGEMEAAYGRGLFARLVARLLELASLPDRLGAVLRRLEQRTEPFPTAEPAPVPGWGLGVVEAARGRLIHRVCLQGERVERYQILAPTEWNFHPEGLLVQGLLGLEQADEPALRRQASLLIGAIDPCVSYQVEFL